MSNQVDLPPNKTEGLYKGPSHANNGIAVVIDGVKPVEVEGDEYHICDAVYKNSEVLNFENKTNKQILKEIFQKSHCVFEQGKAGSGDFIVCKLVVNDPTKRTIKGTAKEIIDTLQLEKHCNVSNNSGSMRDGGKIESKNVNNFTKPAGFHQFSTAFSHKTTESLKPIDIKAEGGPIDSDKIISSSSRFKPHETIIFDKPLIGPSGAQLISYTWAFLWTMQPNHEGELVSKRMSDWDQALISADTGRDIVHQFSIKMPHGDIKTVSSESVLILLGFTVRAKLKTFPGLVTALKTLAKQKLQFQILSEQDKLYNELRTKFEKTSKPEIKEIEDPIDFVKNHIKPNQHTVYAMGNVWYRQDNPYTYNDGNGFYTKLNSANKNTIDQLTSMWVSDQITLAGGKYAHGLYDLKNRLTRQERKVQEIQKEMGIELTDISPEATKLQSGGSLATPKQNLSSFTKIFTKTFY